MSSKYVLWSGVTFGILAGLEFIFRTPFGGLLHFTPIHNGFNFLVAAVALSIYASKNEQSVRVGSVSIGIVLLVTFLAVMAMPARVSDTLGYPIGWPYLLIHLTLGCAGVIFPFLKGGKNEVSAA